ncbi:Pr6Pr family membrane protein [Planctomonas psychrotolerans]|uniref:Pr6Pr family membrane protein n=1 Tax=Planctomonas psychrotolerans TaxID=2528712 RepID=UPI0012399A4D|nr:Pr6Pr family membrane protein [Planctomonas psychrotolerans]
MTFGLLRLTALAVGIVALIGDFDYVLGFRTFATMNFFSYFTTLSAMILDLVLALGAFSALRVPEDPAWLGSARVLATTYALVSGIVFGAIISQAASHDYRIEVPWSSQMLHFWLPAYALLDWFLAPGRPPVTWKVLRWVLVFPAVWTAFTLVRGPVVGWYPYFFLDPTQVDGVERILYLAGIGVFITGIAAVFVRTSHPLRGWEIARLVSRRPDPLRPASGTPKGSHGRS